MKKSILLITLFIIFPTSTSAIDNGVKIECPSNIQKGEEFFCDITGHSDYEVSALEYEFVLPNYVEKKGFKVSEIWQGDEEDNLVLLYTDENKKNDFAIATIYLKANSDIKQVNIDTKWLLFGDGDFNDHILIDKKNDVNELQEKSKIKKNKDNNSEICVIISLIVVIFLSITSYIIHRKENKK